MRLSGKVKIDFIHKDTGENTRGSVEQTNLIFDETFIHILGFQPRNIFAGFLINPCVIVLLDDATPPVASNPTWTELAFGYVPSGVDSPTWHENIIPYFGEIQNRVDAPSTPLTFNSVGLANNDIGTRGKHFCRTLLSIPCTQQSFEILRIFYQIQVSNDLGDFLPNDRFTRDFGGSLFGVKDCSIYVCGTSYANTPTASYIDLLQSINLIDNNSINNPTSLNFWQSSATINDHYKFKYSKNWKIQQSGIVGDTDEKIGLIFNTILHGLSNSFIGSNFIQNSAIKESTNSCYKAVRYEGKIVNINPLLPVYIPPFQKIWSHRASAPKPFFDENNIAIGTGIIQTSGAWNGRLPELLKVIIIDTGEAGISTYKIAVRKHLGFEANTYIDRLEICPFRNQTTPSATGMHGYRLIDNDVHYLNNTKVVQYDSTGITVLDIFNGDYQNYDISTSPGVPVTALRQVAVDITNNLVYCACRNTGLWIINLISNTVTHPITAPCYGVDVGFNNIAFAISSSGLLSSTNWSILLPVDIVKFGGSFSNCYYLKSDPSNADNHLAFVVDDNIDRKIVWYNDSLGITYDGLVSPNIGLFCTFLDVSDNGFWVTLQGFKLNFSLNTQTSLPSSIPQSSLNHPIWGNISFGKVSFYKNFLITTNKLIKIDLTTENEYLPLTSDSTFLVHISNGICVSNEGVKQIFSDNTYCWDNYGWNGSAWIIGHSGARLTHSSPLPIINGLEVKFTNGATPPSFVSGDFYTQSLNYGILKDNATTIYLSSAWYSHPVYFDESIPSGATVPVGLIYTFPVALNIDFLRIETDSVKLHKLKINGTDVLNIYTDSTPPGVGEININGVNGTVLFNAADTGKSFSGIYTWIGI